MVEVAIHSSLQPLHWKGTWTYPSWFISTSYCLYHWKTSSIQPLLTTITVRALVQAAMVSHPFPLSPCSSFFLGTRCTSRLCLTMTKMPEKNNLEEEPFIWLMVTGVDCMRCSGPKVRQIIMMEGHGGRPLFSSWSPGSRERGKGAGAPGKMNPFSAYPQ